MGNQVSCLPYCCCCCGPSSDKKFQKKLKMGVYDIGGHIDNWAHKTWAGSTGRGCVPDQDLRFEIIWGRLRFREVDLKWRWKNMSKDSLQNLFTGSFSNATSSSTGHNIKLDKDTDAQMTIEIKNGQTHGLLPPLSLNLPDAITQATPVFGHALKLDTNVCVSEKTEKIKWAVDSQVPNLQDRDVKARVFVAEKTYEGTFSCTASLEGHVVVQVFRRSDNNFLGIVEEDIEEVFRSVVSLGQNGENSSTESSKHLRIEDKAVKWPLSGSCKFVFGVEHKVRLEETHQTAW